MQKVINDTKNITISDLVNKIVNKEDNVQLIVYYRSQNDRNGLPKFLTLYNNGINYNVGFKSPSLSEIKMYFTSNAPLAKALTDSLVNASKCRDIYVLEGDESDKLFKVQCP